MKKATRTIRGRISKGLIEPLEKVDIAEGSEVVVTIVEMPTNLGADRFKRAAGSWKGTIDVERLINSIYADRLVSTREEPKI